MIITTDFEEETILIDPFSIDLVQYRNTQNYTMINGTDEFPSKLVFITIQGTTVHMLPAVFEADVLPLLMEQAHGIHNARNSSVQ